MLTRSPPTDDLFSFLPPEKNRTEGAADGGPRKGRAVILAGGRGTRLAPYTSVLPKPLMPIGDRAILEIVIDQLAAAGFTSIDLCVGYLSHLIQAVLEGGRPPRATITYLKEHEPLGTAGPLRLVEGLDDPFLVMNGDVLTTVDYQDMFARHLESGNAFTMGVHERTLEIDFGVPKVDQQDPNSPRIVQYSEKPEIQLTISMGVYVIEPRVIDYIPAGCRYDIPDLVRALLDANEPVGAYLFRGFWLDIGRHEDYEVAVELWEDQVKRLQNERDGAYPEFAVSPEGALGDA